MGASCFIMDLRHKDSLKAKKGQKKREKLRSRGQNYAFKGDLNYKIFKYGNQKNE